MFYKLGPGANSSISRCCSGLSCGSVQLGVESLYPFQVTKRIWVGKLGRSARRGPKSCPLGCGFWALGGRFFALGCFRSSSAFFLEQNSPQIGIWGRNGPKKGQNGAFWTKSSKNSHKNPIFWSNMPQNTAEAGQNCQNLGQICMIVF